MTYNEAQRLNHNKYSFSRAAIVTRTDHHGETIWVIDLPHHSKSRKDVQIHVHHHPGTAMGINVRWKGGDNSPRPLPYAFSQEVGRRLGI